MPAYLVKAYHPPPPVQFFLLNQNLYPKDIAGSDHEMMKDPCWIYTATSGKGLRTAV